MSNNKVPFIQQLKTEIQRLRKELVETKQDWAKDQIRLIKKVTALELLIEKINSNSNPAYLEKLKEDYLNEWYPPEKESDQI
jgi:hypothetical protein|tara:strand:- start:556 stop:801 length:246 start_codon:yes stop_codon:yes gene_type:complete